MTDSDRANENAGGAGERGLALVARMENALMGGGRGDDQEVGRLGGAALCARDGKDLTVALGDGFVDEERRECASDGV